MMGDAIAFDLLIKEPLWRPLTGAQARALEDPDAPAGVHLIDVHLRSVDPRNPYRSPEIWRALQFSVDHSMTDRELRDKLRDGLYELSKDLVEQLAPRVIAKLRPPAPMTST